MGRPNVLFHSREQGLKDPRSGIDQSESVGGGIMASKGKDRVRLLACIASVALHATIVVGFAQQTLARDAETAAARRDSAALRNALMSLQFEPSPVPELAQESESRPEPAVVPPVVQEEIVLGAADGGDLPSENWMGFAQPTPHSAPLGRVNQPQLDLQSGGGTEGEFGPEGQDANSTPASASAPVSTPPQPPPPSLSPQPQVESTIAPEPREASAELPETEAPVVEAKPVVRVSEGADEGLPSAEQEAPPAKSDAAEEVVLPPELERLLSSPPVEFSPVQPSVAPTPPSPAPTPPQTGGGGRGEGMGEPSDRQTDASSTERAEIVRPGHPVAAKGLEIVTRRPVFSKVTRVTAFPKNPTVEVTFGRDGRVNKVRLLESSGYSEVDQPVLDAVYAWTARGEALRKIPARDAQAGITIKFTILLR